MRVTHKGQVTIPQEVREDLGVLPAETEVELVKDNGHWYLKKAQTTGTSRFRRAYKAETLQMTTDEIMVLTRGHVPAA